MVLGRGEVYRHSALRMEQIPHATGNRNALMESGTGVVADDDHGL
jgi:hypothetical protein